MSNLNLSPMSNQEFDKASQPSFLFKGFLALAVVVGTLFFTNWTLSKSYFYALVRELAKVSALNKTKGLEVLEGQHFIIHYDPVDAQEARMVLNNADSVYQPVTSILGYTPKGKINVIMYPTRVALSKSFGWAANESAMGVYWAGVIRILAPDQWINSKDSQELRREFEANGPMAHEFSHFVIDYRTRGNYPRWFTEGLAQYTELKVTGFQFNDPEGDLSQPLYPFSQMDKGFDNLPNQSLAYRQSLAAVQFLTEKYGMQSIDQILTDLRKGNNLEQSIRLVTGLSFPEFESNFHAWVKENLK